EPKKQLLYPKKAAGAQITQSQHRKVVIINTNTGLFWKASLVLAAAVILALIAYIKIIVVKKLVIKI
ncbi:hypothetical protein K460DRAFT_297941, partial [Cucurbitaria berberidis CBS 394.84]